ncbi:MAG: NAD-dependent succinate-semialdehyde dehydrogenase [Flavobacteriia bacterium]|nr:NAD-dependent succinate-semialdehyde dehydrogenase [Flavobacteriia bacterium]
MTNQYISIEEAFQKLELAQQLFLKNKNKFQIRPKDKIRKVAEILLKKEDEFAKIISGEMGKPVKESNAEIEKSALSCNFYADNCDEFLKDRNYSTENYDAIVRYEPYGVILGVMPWNFPFWQVFRFAVPTILAGNTVVVKHASNVPKSAQAIEDIFLEAGFEPGTYQNLSLESKNVAQIIEHPYIKAVSLTGSEKAGSSVASTAGKVIKKSVLELGGSNAFIVLNDADLDDTIEKAMNARFRNAGQSCIAAKRFLVQDGIYDRFLEKFKQKTEALKMGDPFDPSTDIGPLARVDLAEDLEKQVNKSVEMGAKLILGGKRDGAYYQPSILVDAKPGMPVFNEETFGPLAVIIKFKDFEEAVELSNSTSFGLGVSICTSNVEEALKKEHLFEEGSVFFNQLVRSDPKLPFGGVKHSGFGRELSEDGIREFVNTKTIVIAK